MLAPCDWNAIRRGLLLFTAATLVSRFAIGQGPIPEWDYRYVSLQQGQGVGPRSESPQPKETQPYELTPVAVTDLRNVSDEELVNLYIRAYQQSLRSVVADQASLVERGRALLQAGYTFNYNQHLDLSNTTHTLPELMLRYRLLERLEMRVAWAGVVLDTLRDRQTGASDSDTSLSDPSIGARLLLRTQRGWFPATSFTLASPLNVTANLNVADRFAPFAGVGYSWMMGESWLLSGSSAAVWTREDDSRFLDFQQTVSVDWMANDRWGVYGEWSSLFPEGARITGMSHTLGPGISYNFTRNFQLDVVALFGLDDPSPDILAQVLLSWRL